MFLKIATAILSVVILGVVALGVGDFALQARQANQSMAEFGLDGWAKSFAKRGAAKAEVEKVAEVRQDEEIPDRVSRDLLPEAPPGWYRVSYSKQHWRWIVKGPDGWKLTREQLEEMEAESARLPGAFTRYNMGRQELDALLNSYVYIKGDTRVLIGLTAKDPVDVSNGIPRYHDDEETRFAKFNGVQFKRLTSYWHWFDMEATIGALDGPRIQITVKARGEEQAVKDILRRIDYARMRAMVDKARGVGRAASPEVASYLREKKAREKEARRDLAADERNHKARVNKWREERAGN